MGKASPAPDDVETNGVEAKVSFLVRALTSPSGGSAVLVRETRTSFVFITDDKVYKLKKPIRDPLINFTTVAARLMNATEEVRLNRRLAPDVYLGLEPLRKLADGTYRFGGPEGQPVDWIVVMRRLPDDGFLDFALSRGVVSRSHIEALAEVLRHFYVKADSVRLSPDVYAGSLRKQILSARAILLDPRLRLSRPRVLFVTGALLRCVADRGLVRRRAEAAPMVEGHGDLRPEHVWLDGTPLVIDCLEFSRPLRIVDPFDELSFLSLECERRGAPWAGRILLARAGEMMGHRPGRTLLAFYQCLRATLRASFSLRHFLEPARRKPGDWHQEAREYFAFAQGQAELLLPAGERKRSRRAPLPRRLALAGRSRTGCWKG